MIKYSSYCGQLGLRTIKWTNKISSSDLSVVQLEVKAWLWHHFSAERSRLAQVIRDKARSGVYASA